MSEDTTFAVLDRNQLESEAGMATSRLHITCALLLIGVLLLGEGHKGMEAVACPLYCLDVDYVTCPSSGSQKLQARCNCCLTPKGCTLHFPDGTQQTCS
ncbi:uncharacterized protein LOC133908920 [Phragmites australis]|uniref:uncharacterized protein LOC133908920 n=1 Tax=Phragmites australis TaxID=29695 RepID=UPI002D768204|nr:uncharacterized protein LOC133908920 [Phragmites australis]